MFLQLRRQFKIRHLGVGTHYSDSQPYQLAPKSKLFGLAFNNMQMHPNGPETVSKLSQEKEGWREQCAPMDLNAKRNKYKI